MPGPQTIETGYAPIKAWVEGVPVEDAARRQLLNIAALPFIHSHVAVMPDVHLGKGATVGSVIATRAAIVPAAVGVDIGCGMMAVRTTLAAGDLPDSLAKLRGGIEAAVPHGGVGLKGGWKDGVPNAVGRLFAQSGLADGLKELEEKHPAIRDAQSVTHLGSLGGGNHFIEVCLDEEERVWAMLHSGSRGIGNRIGTFFIARAREALDRRQLTRPLPDRDLAWLEEGEPLFEDYVAAVAWAQEFARHNREVMMAAVLRVMREQLPSFQMQRQAINCHHNYVERETPLRRARVGHAQGRGAGRRRRPRHHPGLDGRQVLHRARQGQRGKLLLVRARGRAGDVARRGQAAVHAGRSRRGDSRRRVPQGPGRHRRDADGLQGHRRRHGRAGRPRRDRAHAAPGGLREGLRRRQSVCTVDRPV